MSLKRFYKLFGIHLIVKTVNVTKDRIEYIDHINNPKINILKLIQMTTSIPLLIKPTEYKGCLYSDGGLSGNCPIEANDSNNYLCIELIPNKSGDEINDVFDFVKKGWEMYSIDVILIRRYDKKNIKIDLTKLNLNLSSFNLNNDKKNYF